MCGFVFAKTAKRNGYRELRYGGKTYLFKYHREARNWDDSMEQCRREGGTLANLEEEFKWGFATSRMGIPRGHIVKPSKLFFDVLFKNWM